MNNILRTKISTTCVCTLLGIAIVLSGLPMKSASAQSNTGDPTSQQRPPDTPAGLSYLTMEINNPKAHIRDPRLFAAGRLYNQSLSYYYSNNKNRQARVVAIRQAQNAANLFGRYGDMINRQRAVELTSLLQRGR